MGKLDTKLFFIGIILVVAGFVGLGISSLFPKPNQSTKEVQQVNDSVSYIGKNGVTALELLKEKATIQQDSSGMVTSINGKKADTNKKEYWAFYVNGKMAPVGPAEYKTKNSDRVEWKIEKY